MKKSKTQQTYTGINIQYPISQLILSGEKTIETRTYPIPPKYLGKEMLMIETPGRTGKFKSRIVALICFDRCFQYKTRNEFYRDRHKHCVRNSSPWSWIDEKPKWGWSICLKHIVAKPIPVRKRLGIRFTTALSLSIN